jgi:hypothetical protein
MQLILWYPYPRELHKHPQSANSVQTSRPNTHRYYSGTMRAIPAVRGRSTRSPTLVLHLTIRETRQVTSCNYGLPSLPREHWNLRRIDGIPLAMALAPTRRPHGPNPHKQFIIDLSIEINKWKKSGAEIILGGDFNEKLGDTQDGLARLVTQCNLADIHASQHGIQDEPNTYSGC